jgi:hypothetical protein
MLQHAPAMVACAWTAVLLHSMDHRKSKHLIAMNSILKNGVKICLSAFLSSLAIALAVHGHAEEPQDGRDQPLRDAFLDQLVGDWRVERVMKNRKAVNTVHTEWVLNHQFVRLHYRDTATPSQYEAMVFIGYDNAARQYVVHWMDVFGGHFSQPLGFGKHEGNALTVTFNYPDGEFQNTYTFDPKEHVWTSLMRQKDKDGKWTTFAEDHFRRMRG